MLSSLFGKKSDHPLASLKAAQGLVNDLPKNDHIKSLMELTGWVEQIFENNDFKLDHQFALLRLFDVAARPCVRKLAYDFFSPNDTNRVLENRFWLLLNNWSNQSATGYWRIFNRYVNSEKTITGFRDQLPLLSVCAVRAIIEQLKYLGARYHTVDDEIWQRVARLYVHAEQHIYLDTAVSVQGAADKSVTVYSEIARLLTWFGCTVNSLRPLHLHLTERIIAQYGDVLALTEHKQENSLFVFDLQRPASPMRVKVNSNSVASMRFVNVSALQNNLQDLIKILEKHVVPESLNLSGSYHAEWVSEAAQHLLQYVIAPPLRRNTRHTVQTQMQILRGFERVQEGLNPLTQDAILTWQIRNISVGGFCATTSSQGLENLRVGDLLATLPNGSHHWGVAIVRRLVRDANNQLQIGAEMLCNQTIRVTAHHHNDEDISEKVIWLPIKDSLHEVLLLLKSNAYCDRYNLRVQLHGKTYMLVPLSLKQHGPDYDLARFKLVEQKI